MDSRRAKGEKEELDLSLGLSIGGSSTKSSKNSVDERTTLEAHEFQSQCRARDRRARLSEPRDRRFNAAFYQQYPLRHYCVVVPCPAQERTPSSGSGSSDASAPKKHERGGSVNKPGVAAALPRMPCVTATGEGPEGKTITGFLYRYNKAEVSIVCACHGRSFTPAEFVGHAGGAALSHPLRQIVVVG